MSSLAVSLYAACSAPYFLLVDAEVWAWPRPLVAAVDRVKPVVDRALVAVTNARWDVREMAAEARVYVRLSLRDAVVSAAALLMLLRQNPETLR